jgi:hypothetical protein
VRRAGVEALELRVEVRVPLSDQRRGEGLVEGVEGEDSRVPPEGASHVAPDKVVLALQIACTLLSQKWWKAIPAALVAYSRDHRPGGSTLGTPFVHTAQFGSPSSSNISL